MMSRLITTTTVLFLFISQWVSAEPITEQQANTVAVNYLKAKTGRTGLKAVLSYKQVEADGTNDFYVFNFLSFNGFVIVTADDNIEPVIAYSTESAFDINIAMKCGVSDWIYGVRKQVQDILKNKMKADERIKGLWEMYLAGSQITFPVSSAVTPLLTTRWNQLQNIAGFQFYNSMCPYDFDSSRNCPTGCTATAMAQIMKYWNQPKIGIGSHSYLHLKYGTLSANFGATVYGWANMPDEFTSANDPHDVDLLMYHCGVSIDMNYTPDGSAALMIGPFWSAQYAYVNYFGYRNTIQGVAASAYTPSAWVSLLKSELDAARPIQYQGFNGNILNYQGHSWVVDGYNASNDFHMNWGWGGQHNGYYSLSNLNPGYNFNADQGALIGIWPGTLSDCDANWTLVGAQGFDYTWQASDYITSSMDIQSNTISKYTAANQIILTPGFHAGLNSNFQALIQPCMTFRGMDPASAISAHNNKDNFSAYPNPFNDMLSFSLKLETDEPATIKIFNSQMQLIDIIKNNEMLKKGNNVFDYSGAKLQAGMYFISIQTLSLTKTLKIIKVN